MSINLRYRMVPVNDTIVALAFAIIHVVLCNTYMSTFRWFSLMKRTQRPSNLHADFDLMISFLLSGKVNCLAFIWRDARSLYT